MSKAPGNVSDYDGSGEWFKVHEWGVSINPDAKSKYDRVLWHSMNQDQVSPSRLSVFHKSFGPLCPFDLVVLEYLTCNLSQFTFKLPTTTPPGQYLLRIESAQITASFNSTQRFVQCAQIDVEGPGGGKCPRLGSYG